MAQQYVGYDTDPLDRALWHNYRIRMHQPVSRQRRILPVQMGGDREARLVSFPSEMPPTSDGATRASATTRCPTACCRTGWRATTSLAVLKMRGTSAIAAYQEPPTDQRLRD
jgi:hypothetical protein